MGLRNVIPDKLALWIADPALRRSDARQCALRGDFNSFCRLIGFKPNDAQLALFNTWQAGTRRLVARIGRRGGKSAAVAMMAAFCSLKDDQPGWIVAPTHDLCTRVWTYYRNILCGNGPIHPLMPDTRGLGFGKPEVTRDSLSAPLELRFAWGSFSRGKSTEGEGKKSLDGESLAWLIWDECAYSPDVWDDHLMPNLADRAGWAAMIGKPYGYNHFYAKWQRGSHDPKSEQYEQSWRSFHYTSEVNFEQQPNLRQDFLEAQRNATPEEFAQEWLASFELFAGRVYKEFDEGVHCTKLKYNPDLPLVLAFDFGAENPFVCLWLQFDQGDNCYVIDEWSTAHIRDGAEQVYRTMTTQECGEAILAQHAERGYGPWAWAVADRSGADQIRTLRRHCGINALYRHVTPDNRETREVPAGIARVRRFLREGRLLVDEDRCPVTVYEFNQYRYPEQKTDRRVTEVPLDTDNHAMSCVRYAIIMYLSRHPQADRPMEHESTLEVEDGLVRLPTRDAKSTQPFPPASERLLARVGRRHR